MLVDSKKLLIEESPPSMFGTEIHNDWVPASAGMTDKQGLTLSSPNSSLFTSLDFPVSLIYLVLRTEAATRAGVVDFADIKL